MSQGLSNFSALSIFGEKTSDYAAEVTMTSLCIVIRSFFHVTFVTSVSKDKGFERFGRHGRRDYKNISAVRSTVQLCSVVNR